MVNNLPEKIQNAPEILPGLEIFYEAFMDLASSRGHTAAGPAPIPFSEISAWAMRYEIEGDTFELLLHFIRRLDGVYLEFVSKQSK